MIHEIWPHRFDNHYVLSRIQPQDTVLLYRNNDICLQKDDNGIVFPIASSIPGFAAMKWIYLFSIDAQRFFTTTEQIRQLPDDFAWVNRYILRLTGPKHLAFAGCTGYQLYIWYRDHQYCGYCGSRMQQSHQERALVCPHCSCTVYPRISPAIVVGIVCQDRILLTRYADRLYGGIALVAGFNEIGETLEDTVKREVREETGLTVHDIRYYGSMPWGYDSDLLVAYWARADERQPIHLQHSELASAKWVKREDLPIDDDPIVIGLQMIQDFRLHPERFEQDQVRCYNSGKRGMKR